MMWFTKLTSLMRLLRSVIVLIAVCRSFLSAWSGGVWDSNQVSKVIYSPTRYIGVRNSSASLINLQTSAKLNIFGYWLRWIKNLISVTLIKTTEFKRLI